LIDVKHKASYNQNMIKNNATQAETTVASHPLVALVLPVVLVSFLLLASALQLLRASAH
jgi:hypothetical protein